MSTSAWTAIGYERPVASLYCRSTSTGIRPWAGTAIPLSVAQARITLGSRLALALAERDVDAFFGRLRRVCPHACRR